MRRLGELREAAVEYLERHLGFQIPDEVAHGVPPRDLLLIASQKGRRRTHACVVLKVMHVLHHLAGRELLTKLPVSDDQIFHLVEEKVLRTVEEIKAVGCPVVEFEWSRKHADSLITKLLAKKESIAADVYDKLRFRMITNTEEQLIFVMRELTQRLVPFNYVIPGQSVNDIIKIRETLDRSPALNRFLPEITDLAAVAADKKPSPLNEFSGPGYRVINFVSDLPVRIDKYLCRRPDDPIFAEYGTIVFVLTEFQIVDARTAENNESGENSHDNYKERQAVRVKARLMHGMKDERRSPRLAAPPSLEVSCSRNSWGAASAPHERSLASGYQSSALPAIAAAAATATATAAPPPPTTAAAAVATAATAAAHRRRRGHRRRHRLDHHRRGAPRPP